MQQMYVYLHGQPAAVQVSDAAAEAWWRLRAYFAEDTTSISIRATPTGRNLAWVVILMGFDPLKTGRRHELASETSSAWPDERLEHLDVLVDRLLRRIDPLRIREDYRSVFLSRARKAD